MKTWQPRERDIARFPETCRLDSLDVEHLADEIEDAGYFIASRLVSGGLSQIFSLFLHD